MEQDKKVDISSELHNQTQPWLEYLIENYKNPNKVNSCLDVSNENIRFLEALINQAQNILKDFRTLKELTFCQELKRKEKNTDVQLPTTIAD